MNGSVDSVTWRINHDGIVPLASFAGTFNGQAADSVVNVSGLQYQDVTFTFTPPVDCVFGIVNMTIKKTNTTSLQTRLAIGSGSDPYPGGHLNGDLSKDAYFVIEGTPTTTVSNPPIITLVGNNPLGHIEGDSFVDPGVTASDLEDGDLTFSVVVSGDTVDETTAPGDYTITYTVTDSGGLSASTTRSVIVVPADRLEQLEKDAPAGGGSGPRTQELSCGDLSGQIEEVTMSLSSSGATSLRVYFNKPGEVIGTGTRFSDIGYSSISGQADTSFTFSPPVDIDGDLCAGGNDVALMTVDHAFQSSTQTFDIYGSDGSVDAYPNGMCTTCGGGKDLYFIVNGNAVINHVPTLDPIGNKTGSEGHLLSFQISGSDQDQVAPLTYSADNLPDNAYFDPSTRAFRWVPAYDQAGVYSIEFTVTDNGNEGTLPESDSETITITVDDGTPVLHRLEQLEKDAPAGGGSGPRTQELSCGDLSGQIEEVTMSLSSSGATSLRVYFNKPGEVIGTGTRFSDIGYSSISGQADTSFTFSPPVDIDGDLCAGGNDVALMTVDHAFQSSTQTFDIYGSDGSVDAYPNGMCTTCGGGKDLYFIVNGNAPENLAPTLDLIGPKTGNENQLLEFTVTASDPDNDNLTFTANNLPSGATLVQQDATSALFSWTPSFTQAGNYPDVEITVTDDGTPMELDLELFTISIGNVNRPPEISNPGPQGVLEEEPLSFTVAATDPDGDDVTLTSSGTPSGANFDATTGQFTWTPTLSDAGVYVVTFIATDSGSPLEESEINVVITVGDNPTPTEQAEDLVEDVVNADLPTNIENSYLANLKKVAKFIEDGKLNPAINQLNAFLSKVEGDIQQGEIDPVLGNMLIDAAEALIAELL